MAESLGEAFVEVLADTSPFEGSLTAGLSDALEGVDAEVSAAFGNIGSEAEAAFSEVSAAAEGAAVDTSAAFDDTAAEIQSSLDGISFEGFGEKVRENLGKISIGAAAGGAALEGFARSQRDTRLDAQNLAAQTGMSVDSMNALIASTSDATFPLEDVAALMQSAARRGLEGSDALADFANFWDMVGDATGESAVELGKASVALGQVGIGAGEEGEALDAFGFIMNNTESSIGDFMRMLGMVGSELGDNTPSVNEMAAALSALEDEGFDARRAQSELRRELTKAEGDIGAALEALGVSEDAYRAQTDAVEGAGSAIEGNAARFAASRTPIERMTAAIQAQLFEMPFLAEGAAALAGPLAAVGPAAMGFTHGISAIQTISGGFVKALGAVRTAFTTLGAAILANPIFLIIAAIVAIIAIFWVFRDQITEALGKTWDWVKDKTQAFWDWITGAIASLVESVVEFWDNLRERISEVWQNIVDTITGVVERIRDFVVDGIRTLVDTVIGFFRNFFNFYRDIWRRIFDVGRSIVNRIRTFVTDAFNNAVSTVTGAFTRLRQSVTNILNNVLSFVTGLPGRIVRGLGNLGRLLFNTGRDMISGLLDGARSLLKNIGKFFVDMVPKFIRGPFEKALGISSPSKVFAELGRDTMEGFGIGIEDEFRQVERMLGTLGTEMPVSLRAEELGQLQQQSAIGRGGGTTVNFTVNNPEPEPASQSATREIRKLAAIGVFGD